MILVIVRTLIMYAVLLISLRVLGKRQLGQLELSEFVLAAVAADLASQPLQDVNIPLINGLMPVLILLCVELLISGLALRSPGFRLLLRGRPSILIKKGQLQPMELEKNRLSTDELREQLRHCGCIDPASVRWAILETDGKLSLISSGPEEAPEPYPVCLISRGRLQRKNLEKLGKSPQWLSSELKKLGCSSPKELYYLSAAPDGSIYHCPMP